jgi:hypothetical protein
MAAKFILHLAVAMVCLDASYASADGFAERCRELSQQVRISVIFEDRQVITDESRNIEALNGLSGKRADAYHHRVYGLTHAEPYFRLSVVPRGVFGDHGQICAMPDIAVSFGFSEITVYLARELTNPCRRNVIREHEEEHVKTWKAHLRASAQLLTPTLLREVGEPRIYTSRDDTEAGIRAWANELVTPWAKRIVANVREAQEAIDTPTMYAAVASRLRACPGPA